MMQRYGPPLVIEVFQGDCPMSQLRCHALLFHAMSCADVCIDFVLYQNLLDTHLDLWVQNKTLAFIYRDAQFEYSERTSCQLSMPFTPLIVVTHAIQPNLLFQATKQSTVPTLWSVIFHEFHCQRLRCDYHETVWALHRCSYFVLTAS